MSTRALLAELRSRGVELVVDRGRLQYRPVSAVTPDLVRRYNARQEADHRLAWCDYERRMRDLHWSLGDEHDRKLKKLENGHHENGHHEEATA
jgi:hypothetical protein